MSSTTTYDPFIQGIKKELQATLKAGAFTATAMLIYVCIDALSFLSIPIEQIKQTKNDFIRNHPVNPI